MSVLLAVNPAQVPPSDGTASTAITVAIIMATAGLLGTIVGAWYTFRSARKNAEVTRETERNKLDNESWAGWREDVNILRRQRKEDRDEYSAHREECDEKIRQLTGRVEDMDKRHAREREAFTRQRVALENRVDALTGWGRRVVNIMRAQGIVFPPPPPGVTDTNPEGLSAQTWD